MGGAYVGHPPLRPFQVRVVNKEHPITQGIQDFMVNDEQHYVTYDKAGWAYEYGKGRVVFTAVGHTNHAMWVPAHFALQKRAVRWLLKQI
jgi:hypothetical protein